MWVLDEPKPKLVFWDHSKGTSQINRIISPTEHGERASEERNASFTQGHTDLVSEVRKQMPAFGNFPISIHRSSSFSAITIHEVHGTGLVWPVLALTLSILAAIGSFLSWIGSLLEM